MTEDELHREIEQLRKSISGYSKRPFFRDEVGDLRSDAISLVYHLDQLHSLLVIKEGRRRADYRTNLDLEIAEQDGLRQAAKAISESKRP